MENWQWRVPPIVYGRGSAFSELVSFLALHGKRWAVCCGRHFFEGEWSRWREVATSHGLQVSAYVVSGGEPTTSMVDTLCQEIKNRPVDGVVGIGGGSVLDTAKAVAAMMVHEGSVVDYLEEVGTRKLSRPPLPWVGVPTTAGTGSEATKNAVIIVPEKRMKRSLRHESLWATGVFLDPDLTLSQPWEVTVNTALDAFTHLLEAAVSRKSHPWVFGLADGSLVDIVEFLMRVKDNPNDHEARGRLLVASTAGGIALANGGLGAVHGFAATIGGMTSVAHGRVCGILLDHVVEVNSRYTDVYERLTLVKRHGGVKGFVRFLAEWKRALGVERDFRHVAADLDPREIVAFSTSSSMRANPVDVPPEVWEMMWKDLLGGESHG